MLENGLLLRKEEICYNTRTKYYISDSGEEVPYETMICSRPVFGDGYELSEISKEVEYRLDYLSANEELFEYPFRSKRGYVPEKKTRAELLDQSRRRARRKIFDYCICNSFDLFITLTLSADEIDRSDYGAVIKKLNSFLGNRVRRNGLRYIGVPEYHKNGGLHFHFVTNSRFKLIDSGCVAVDGNKKPMKVATADRKGIPLESRHTVYNIADWKLGFSTAIFTYGERGSLAHYLSKELCKDVQKSLAVNGSIDKIGGRWYYHSNNLNKPLCRYSNTPFKDIRGESYSVATDGGDFKVFKYSDNGEVLR